MKNDFMKRFFVEIEILLRIRKTSEESKTTLRLVQGKLCVRDRPIIDTSLSCGCGVPGKKVKVRSGYGVFHTWG